jgi:phosphopantothenate synthetase
MHKWFMEGQEEVEDDRCPRCPSTSKTKENVEKISEIVRKDQCLSIRMIAEMVNMDKEMVRQILNDQLNTKVCAKMVLKNLTQEQKDSRKSICSDMERFTE